VRGDGKPSQALDDTEVDADADVERLPANPPNGTGRSASAEQVAADLRRRELLRPEDLLPVGEVANRLGLSASTIHEAINAGKLRSVLFGSVRRVRPEDLEAYMRSRSAARPPTDEDWSTVAELRRALGCSRSHTYRLLARRDVPFAIFGGTRYIRRRDVTCVLDEIDE